MCRFLNNNKLNGSVPSSLSTLTNLELLCVLRPCQLRLRVRPMLVGSVGSAPSARRAGVGGCISGGIERGGVTVGLSRYFCGISPQGLKGYSPPPPPPLVPFDGTGLSRAFRHHEQLRTGRGRFGRAELSATTR